MIKICLLFIRLKVWASSISSCLIFSVFPRMIVVKGVSSYLWHKILETEKFYSIANFFEKVVIFKQCTHSFKNIVSTFYWRSITHRLCTEGYKMLLKLRSDEVRYNAIEWLMDILLSDEAFRECVMQSIRGNMLYLWQVDKTGSGNDLVQIIERCLNNIVRVNDI